MVLTMQQLQAKMNNLKDISKHKIVGSAIYKASLPMEQAQKSILNSKTQKKTGRLDESIGRIRVPISKATDVGQVRIGPRVGGKYKGYHGHLIEFGTKERYTKSGKYTGKGPKLPYIQPAYVREINNVRDQIVGNMQRILNRWVKTGRIAEI